MRGGSPVNGTQASESDDSGLTTVPTTSRTGPVVTLAGRTSSAPCALGGYSCFPGRAQMRYSAQATYLRSSLNTSSPSGFTTQDAAVPFCDTPPGSVSIPTVSALDGARKGSGCFSCSPPLLSDWNGTQCPATSQYLLSNDVLSK